MRKAMLCLVAACGGGGDDGPRQMTFGDDRPVDLDVPAVVDNDREYPLIIALHGYGGNGFQHSAYFGLGKLVNDGAAIMLAPDGTVDVGGRQFWNADPACCDFHGKNPDDVGYIGKLVEDVMKAWPVDKSRVVIIGHSNGGFMAYRMACERPDLFTAIAGLAGAATSNPSICKSGPPVNVLHIHGTADTVITYPGTASVMGAEASANQWVSRNGCTPGFTAAATQDLDSSVVGSETQNLVAACPTGIAVELWKIEGGSHIPNFGPAFTPALWQWLGGHQRTSPRLQAFEPAWR